MSLYYVSPNYPSSKLQAGRLEDKIEVVEDQMKGWLIGHAKFLASPAYANTQHAGFAILAIISSYFESIASYLLGQSSANNSARFFAHGFSEVFPTLLPWIQKQGLSNPQKELESIAGEYYKEVRCGLFHEAMTRGRVAVVGGDADPLQMSFDRSNKVARILINPFRLVGVIERHFDEYLAKLREPAETTLRANFEKEWNRRAS